jgi:hypothetical protein
LAVTALSVSVVIRISVEKNLDEISGRPNFQVNFQVNFRVVELILVRASKSRKAVDQAELCTHVVLAHTPDPGELAETGEAST